MEILTDGVVINVTDNNNDFDICKFAALVQMPIMINTTNGNYFICMRIPLEIFLLYQGSMAVNRNPYDDPLKAVPGTGIKKQSLQLIFKPMKNISSTCWKRRR